MSEEMENNSMYTPSAPYQEGPSHKKRNIIFVLVGVIIIIGIVFVVRSLMKKTQEKLPQAQEQTETQATQEPAVQEARGKLIEPPENDKDRDGILDEEEKKYGTSDFEIDTDGDALSDKMEIEFWKTDPTKTDSDGDGYNDGYEVFRGYNPAGPGKLE